MKDELKICVLEKVCAGDVDREAAALELGISVRTVNRWMSDYGMKRVTRDERASVRRETKTQLRELIEGMSPREAADAAGVSLRTIYRWQNQKKPE